MVVIISFIVIALIIVTVATPFIWIKRRRILPGFSLYQEFLAQRENIYHEINTIELEYSLGAISFEQYGQRIQGARFRAANVFYEQEKAIPVISRIDDQIEKQIARELKKRSN